MGSLFHFTHAADLSVTPHTPSREPKSRIATSVTATHPKHLPQHSRNLSPEIRPDWLLPKITWRASRQKPVKCLQTQNLSAFICVHPRFLRQVSISGGDCAPQSRLSSRQMPLMPGPANENRQICHSVPPPPAKLASSENNMARQPSETRQVSPRSELIGVHLRSSAAPSPIFISGGDCARRSRLSFRKPSAANSKICHPTHLRWRSFAALYAPRVSGHPLLSHNLYFPYPH